MTVPPPPKRQKRSQTTSTFVRSTASALGGVRAQTWQSRHLGQRAATHRTTNLLPPSQGWDPSCLPPITEEDKRQLDEMTSLLDDDQREDAPLPTFPMHGSPIIGSEKVHISSIIHGRDIATLRDSRDPFSGKTL